MLPGGAAPESITEERLTQKVGWADVSTYAVSGFLTHEHTCLLDVMALIRGPSGSKHLHRC